MQLRNLADDLIERRVHEAIELDLDDGAEPAEREPDGGPHDAGLGQRRVDDALRTELVEEPVRDAEHAAELADVLAHHEHAVVVGHRAPQTLVDGLRHGELRHRPAPWSEKPAR